MTPPARAWRLEDVARRWDLAAGRYLELFRDELRGKPYDLDVLARFARALGPGARVLDAGCGPCGHVTRVLADHGLDVAGVDVSPVCVELARREQPALRFEVADMADLGLPVAALDGLVAYYAFHDQPRSRVRDAVRELARVLRPGGRLLVAAKEGTGEGFVEDPLGSGQEIFWSAFGAGELSALIAEQGFSVLGCDARAPLEDEIAVRRIFLSAERA